MRYAAVALVAAALLAIWLATQGAGRTDQILRTIELDAASVDEATSNGPLAIHSDVARPVASAEQTSMVSLSTATNTQSSLPPGFRQNPELLGQIIAYLSESGLSEADSKRIAAQALDGLKCCVEVSLGNDDEGTRNNLLQVCMLNVLADYGLPVGGASLTRTP
jgi:hypothetical protein